MTKKSQGRQQRDRAAQAKAHALATGTPQQPQVMAKPYRPANLGGFKPTENGGYKLTAADRILAECRQGAGAVPSKMKNTCWDDLMDVYREAAAMLFKHTMVSQLLADNDLLAYLDDHITFNMNVKQFAADLGQINKELAEILAQHTGRTGGSDDPDEVLSSFAIYEQYKLWMTRHDGVINPTVTHILEQTNAAELKRGAAHQVAAAGLFNGEVPAENLDAGVLDVNTITDVQFQDVKPADEVSVNENAKPARGQTQYIVHVDELGVQDTPVHGLNIQASIDAGIDAERVSQEGSWTVGHEAHHPQHHKHEHQASA